MIIVLLAAIGATIVVGLLVALAVAFGGGVNRVGMAARALGPWAARLWLINFALDLALLYFDLPALTGPYGGWQWLLWPLLVSGALALFGGSLRQAGATLNSLNEQINAGSFTFSARSARGGGRGRRAQTVIDATRSRGGAAPATSLIAGGVAIALVFVIAIGLNGLIVVTTTWFDANAKALAHIPTIITEPKTAQLPPTDVNHIVLVSRGNAAYLGQQVLAGSGQNLGSTYHTDRTEYTLQSVNGHLYWIAPLVYNNVWANLGHWESPGFVVVDAEDPNVSPLLRVGYHLRYLPDALFNQDLARHVYLSGYTTGNLADPTLEVDDSWRPYFTLTLTQPSRGFTGDTPDRVLLVDAQSGAIQSYALKDVPTWVDRVIPADMVTQYLTWWGLYDRAPWFNPSGSGQQAPAVDQNDQPQLIYDQVGARDYPVWLVPMTSSAATDNSSTGIILYDTRDNVGRFYPLSGLGVTANVKSTFMSSPLNIRNYDVANVQLYEIYGEPTWVATFVQSNQFGEVFQAVGMLDARHLSGANVIMQPSKAQALATYAQSLANRGVTGTPVPTGKTTAINGKVARISSATQNGATVYFIQIVGDTRIFEAGLAISPELPLTQAGDEIQGQFLDTGQAVVTLSAFQNVSLTVGPQASATPAVTATAGH